MDANEQVSQILQKRLGGDYSVETRTNFFQYDIDRKADAGFVFVIKNSLIESDPAQAQKDILAALGKIDPLKPHVKVETETNHMERLAKELEYFRAQELALGDSTTIHDKLPDWFRELPKRGEWNIKHALNISKTSDGIIGITINIPSDVSPDVIVKNIESRKGDILAVLAERVAKYTDSADTPEKKQALKELVKRLEFSVTSADTAYGKGIDISIMSPEQSAAKKLPGGITPDKVQGLNVTNPLLALQNGEDDLDKTKPQPHLQKALSRAILFAGNTETASETAKILPYILGKEDMRRMVGKSLTVLKGKVSGNPELVKRIDDFLADSVFKDSNNWGKPLEKQEDVAETPRINKVSGELFGDLSSPYEPGVMTVTVKIPADKFPTVRDQIAALDGQGAGQIASSDMLGMIDNRIKPLAEALVTTIQNQQQIANRIVEQESKLALQSPQTTAQQGLLEKAAIALTNAANRLMSWVDRVEAPANSQPVEIPQTLPSDEVLANNILAAAAANPTTSDAAAMAAVSSWTERTSKNTAEQQVRRGA